jgi:hypothetical protein
MHAFAVALVLIHGVVMRGPTKPVCEMATPCSEPAAHVTLTFGGVVVRTDAPGRYAVRLKPGRYVVRISPPPQIGRGLEPTSIVVTRPRELDFNLDTGIR